MAAQDHVFVAAGGYEAAHPLQVTFNIIAGFSGGMSRKVDRFGVSEMPKLVIIGKAGTSSPVEEYQFHSSRLSQRKEYLTLLNRIMIYE